MVLLEISQNNKKTPVPESFFNKVAGLRPDTEETLTQVFFCEFL